jgi:tRNA A-37 threonylcarbamoyl transferase component Bud32
MLKDILRGWRDLLTMDVKLSVVKSAVDHLDGAPFKLRRLEGKGGYTVFSAIDKAGLARYIIKVGNLFKGNKTMRIIRDKRRQYVYLDPPRRFRRENDILKVLSESGLGPHPIIASGNYFIEEHVPGEKFSDLFRQGRADIAALLKILKAIARMHSLGVVHGDLRPYNVLMYDDKISFIDFEHSLDPDRFTNRQMKAFDYMIFLHELNSLDASGILSGNPGSIRAEISKIMPADFDKNDVTKVMEEFEYGSAIRIYFF